MSTFHKNLNSGCKDTKKFRYLQIKSFVHFFRNVTKRQKQDIKRCNHVIYKKMFRKYVIEHITIYWKIEKKVVILHAKL